MKIDKLMKYETWNMKKKLKSLTPILQYPTLFIVGPTASGKSGLAMELALKLNGEIVCADSQTLRKDLNIGTAKPSDNDRIKVRHHMLDVISPYGRFSVNEFKRLAKQAIIDIRSRGKLPIIVGGSGLYIDALFFNFELEEQIEITEYKQRLEKLSVSELKQIIKDNKYSMPSNTENSRHLIGTILRKGAVYENIEPIAGARIYGILPDDKVLKQRISDRVESMFDSGLVAEVSSVIDKYGQPPENLDAIGYPIVAKYLVGKMTIDEVKERLKNAHWQYARRQKSWFKRNSNIKWFPSDKVALNTIIEELETTLNKSVTIET